MSYFGIPIITSKAIVVYAKFVMKKLEVNHLNKLNCKQVDIGDKCIECMQSTVFGSGLFVNRLPADNDKYIGYLCPECNWHECDRCNEKIYLDEDCTPYDVYDSLEPTEFSDGSYRVHYDCLTEEEKSTMELNNS